MCKKKVSIFNFAKTCLSNFIQIPKCPSVKSNSREYDLDGLKRGKELLSPKISNLIDILNNRKYSTTYNRHGYDEKVEVLINEQINAEFSAGYTYLNIASYFGRSNIALPGCYGYFMKMYFEEQDHAMSFIRYQNMRGGIVHLSPITTIENTEWNDIPKCFDCALTMEKTVKEKLVKLYRTVEQIGDTHVMDMLDSFIDEQEKSIYELSRLLTRTNELSKCNVGKYLFDRELHETHTKLNPAKCTTELGSKLYT